MRILRKLCFTLFFLTAFLFRVFANGPTVPIIPIDRIPDSAGLRKTLAATWLLASPMDVLTLSPQVYTDSTGKRFKVESYKLESQNIVEVKITPEDTIFTKTSNSRTPQGIWILQRDFTTGEPVCIKIFPRETPELFIKLNPTSNIQVGTRSYADFCLFSAYVRKGVAVGISFNDLYYTTLSELKQMTKDTLPWHIFEPPVTYRAVESMSAIIRRKMQMLVRIDDGAFSAFGKPVYIETEKPQEKSAILYAAKNQEKGQEKEQKIKGGVNCSGFVKWIVDGIIKPIAGQGTYITSLKRPTDIPLTNFSSPFAEQRDLFFGLDWIRNLAAARLSLTMRRTVYPQEAGIDVKLVPFAFSLPVLGGRISEQKFGGYFKNVGYQTEYLEALLYYLAITEPGNFYLGAVNQEMGNPSLRQYYHAVAFFPYFDILGNFHIDVYEAAEETDIRDFILRNKKSFTALVRIKAPDVGFFSP
ncbi:MAG: hypothetical protein CR988_05500 [Treponema sp.]|nr:MAG: hypothetical protein CR988_05500 [Treponema sp.]